MKNNPLFQKVNWFTGLQRCLVLLIIMVCTGAIYAQNTRSVTGIVTDTNGESIIGASIKLKGTQTGTVSDTDGKFTLQVPTNAVLVVSYIGYSTQEVAVGSRSNLQISLSEDTQLLNEVVVVGYGTVSRKNLTTSISKVTVDDVPKVGNSNMSQLLLGRAAGLQATVSSSQPGGGVNISIRGAGTPIYVVDGVVMPSGNLDPSDGSLVTPASINRSGLAGLNPEDIESVEILKDASASIYGIGAANGVILITTKRGKDGPVSVVYEGNVSSVVNQKYPDPLTGPEYMKYVNIFAKEQYLFNNKMEPYGTNPVSGWHPIYSEQQIASAPTTDWMGLILRNGSSTQHTVTINGGNKNVNYYVSGNYYDQQGTVQNSSMQRFALRSNLGITLSPIIKMTLTMNFNANKYRNSAVGGTSDGKGPEAAGALTSALSYPPYMTVRDDAGKYTAFRTMPNAVGLLEIEDDTKTYGSYINIAGDINIIKDMLKARLMYGNNLESARRSTYIPSDVYFAQMYSPRGNLAESRRMNQTLEASLMFNKRFFDAVNADFVLGAGLYYNHTEGMATSYDGQYDAIGNDNLGSVSGTVTPTSYRTGDEKRSQFLRANFDILDRYVVSVTMRRDGTDKFFPSKKYALFPAVSAAWKISNESFLKDIAWINLLKLRASYGVTGSDNLGSTLYGTYGPTPQYVIFNNGGVKYVPVSNNGLDYPDVSWQRTTMMNIGVDFYLLNDRISGSFDVFRNDITDMLGYANTAGLSMFSTYPINGAHQRRQGWDATLNTKNIQNKSFTWNTVLTLTKYGSYWIERMPNYDYNQYERRGKVTTNAQYYYETAGLINLDKSNMPVSQPAAAQIPGYPIIVDQNGDGQITIDDIKMRDLTPKLYFGFGNTFTYKNFDLDIFAYSQLGIRKWNYALEWAAPTELSNETSNANKYIDRVWTIDNPSGTLPGIGASLATVSLPGGAGTDVRFQDASFVRVRNITLGYNLREKQMGSWLKKVFSNLRIYADVQNPLCITSFEGFDPEVYTGGGYKGGKAEYPQVTTYSVGIKINFK